MNVGPSSVVVRVGSVRLTLARYVRHLRWQLLFDHASGARERANVVPFTLLRTLATEELVRQSAGPSFGVSVTRAAIAAAHRAHIGEDADAARKLREILRVTGLSDAEYRAIIGAAVLADGLEEHFARGADTTPAELLLRAYHDPDLPIELGWVPVRVLPGSLRRGSVRLRPGRRTRALNYNSSQLVLECVDERSAPEPDAPADLDRWLALEERLGRVTYKFDSDRYAWAIEQVGDLLRADPAALVATPA